MRCRRTTRSCHQPYRVPRRRAAVARRPWPGAIVASQQPVTPGYSPPGHDPKDALRKEADAAASSVFFLSGGQGQTAATVAQAAPGAASTLAAFDPLAGPASTAAQPAIEAGPAASGSRPQA